MENNVNMKQQIKCPNCNSKNIIKRGSRSTQNRGLIQRYGCKDCNKRFVENDGFFKMKNNPQKVTLCLDLFYKGISTRQIQSHLQAFYPHNSSHKTIFKWIVKYSKMISKFTDNLKLKVGEELQVDEMEYGSKKSQYKGWFIDSIDTETRFMVASNYAKSRNQTEIKFVLKLAKQKTENQLKIITTDGYGLYLKMIRLAFGDHNLKRGLVIHNKVTQLKKEGFNHKVERMHSSIRHRTKTFRGFHGSINSANAIMKGYEIYYNFIRKHQAIGKCPYELATDVKLENPNKWLDLIRLSQQS